MPVVDLHAHWTPNRYREAIAARGEWHGLDAGVGELENSGFVMTAEERIADMDALGVDMQLVSPTDGFYQYSNAPETTAAIARESNDDITELVERHPDRFAGLGTLPMQDVPAAVAELHRVMGVLGLKGVMIGDLVGDASYDEPQFLPFWEAAESLGALVFFHQGDYRYKIGRYCLDNSIGNLVERSYTFGTLVGGGILDRFPGLKLLLAHAGGYVPYAVARMDKTAGAFSEDTGEGGYSAPYKALLDYDGRSASPPSAYLRRFYYDCCTFSAANLRFLIDMVGVDRVVLGTDAPAPMVLTDAVRWIDGLDCLSEAEKRAILVDNAATLLG